MDIAIGVINRILTKIYSWSNNNKMTDKITASYSVSICIHRIIALSILFWYISIRFPNISQKQIGSGNRVCLNDR